MLTKLITEKLNITMAQVFGGRIKRDRLLQAPC